MQGASELARSRGSVSCPHTSLSGEGGTACTKRTAFALEDWAAFVDDKLQYNYDKLPATPNHSTFKRVVFEPFEDTRLSGECFRFVRTVFSDYDCNLVGTAQPTDTWGCGFVYAYWAIKKVKNDSFPSTVPELPAQPGGVSKRRYAQECCSHTTEEKNGLDRAVKRGLAKSARVGADCRVPS